MRTTYIYTNENGDHKQALTEPTDTDRQMADDGTMSILRVSDGCVEIYGDGHFSPLPVSNVVQIPEGDYHD